MLRPDFRDCSFLSSDGLQHPLRGCLSIWLTRPRGNSVKYLNSLQCLKKEEKKEQEPNEVLG